MLAIACDHGGYELKKEILKHLDKRGIAYRDFGCDSTEAVDYPIYARKVTDAITGGECERGILICGTGIGISIAANKVKGIRAALCTDCFTAEATRQHAATLRGNVSVLSEWSHALLLATFSLPILSPSVARSPRRCCGPCQRVRPAHT